MRMIPRAIMMFTEFLCRECFVRSIARIGVEGVIYGCPGRFWCWPRADRRVLGAPGYSRSREFPVNQGMREMGMLSEHHG